MFLRSSSQGTPHQSDGFWTKGSKVPFLSLCRSSCCPPILRHHPHPLLVTFPVGGFKAIWSCPPRYTLHGGISPFGRRPNRPVVIKVPLRSYLPPQFHCHELRGT